MSTLQIVTVKDLAVQAFMTPTFVQHVGAAIREFTDAANNPEHHFCKHAPDYELYLIGEYNPADGDIWSSKPGQDVNPRLLCRAVDVKRQVEMFPEKISRIVNTRETLSA